MAAVIIHWCIAYGHKRSFIWYPNRDKPTPRQARPTTVWILYTAGLPWEFRVLLDDLVEGGEDGGDGIVRGAHVPLWVARWQLLNQVSHSVLACNIKVISVRIILPFWYTICPVSSDPFYIVTYYIKWVTTSWIHGITKGPSPIKPDIQP